MIDILAITIGFFLIVILILIGIKFFFNLANISQSSNNYREETDNQLTENLREDSQADLYMTEEPADYGNLMFPEEFDD